VIDEHSGFMDWLWVLIVAVRGLSSSPDDQWATRLGELDRVRAEAFATADPRRLDEVYAQGSDGWRTDEATIGAYARRDGRVIGADLRVLSCRVVQASPDRVSLEVVDQLGPARVRWGNGTSTDLPRDRPSRRALTVIRTADGWRIAESGQVSLPR